jgi:hypothetical protein
LSLYTDIAADISGNNIAFTCGNVSIATEKRLFKGYQKPKNLIRLEPLDTALLKYLVKIAEWD